MPTDRGKTHHKTLFASPVENRKKEVKRFQRRVHLLGFLDLDICDLPSTLLCHLKKVILVLYHSTFMVNEDEYIIFIFIHRKR